MGRKAATGNFVPANPQKYIGANVKKITYRSGWELQVMRMFDRHPNVVKWSSESLSVPYTNPLTGKKASYVPDFLVVYLDKHGRHHCEMIEVKPAKENPFIRQTGRITARGKLVLAINAAKWQAAMGYCAKNGIFFRVMCEDDLFGLARAT